MAAQVFLLMGFLKYVVIGTKTVGLISTFKY